MIHFKIDYQKSKIYKKMKAILCTSYGPPEVLQIKEIEKPVPNDNEILIKVHTTTVTAGDVRVRRFDVPVLFWLPIRLALGVKRPKQPVLGVEYAGEVEVAGKDIKKFKIGDRVFGSTPWMKFGCYAEYIIQTEDGIISEIPESLRYEDVASVPFMGIGALYFIQKANIRKGQKMLIYGASGAVGTYAVQLAKYFEAEVTAVCSTANQELVKSLGADKTVDYTKEDFSKNSEKYDIFFDAVGKCPFSKAIKSVKKYGIYITADRGLVETVQGALVNLTGNKKVIAGTASPKIGDIDFLKKRIAEDKLKTVIDKIFPFEELVEAHRYVDQGHKKGNVIISVVS